MAHSVRQIHEPVRFVRQGGYSLVEIIVVVIILAILATVAVGSLKSSDDTARMARTRAAMDRLAHAISGNPDLLSGGNRTDFGYVGDVGALPSNLNALVTSPGGYTTWRGPYLSEQFMIDGAATARFKDGWGVDYLYTGTAVIQSTGSGQTLSRQLATSTDHLLYNRLELTVLDLDDSPPGAAYADSVRISLTIPNGFGSMATRLVYPTRDGSARIDSIPVGLHRLQAVYLPTADTLIQFVAIDLGQTAHLQISFPSDLW